jgi:hypothetical protein
MQFLPNVQSLDATPSIQWRVSPFEQPMVNLANRSSHFGRREALREVGATAALVAVSAGLSRTTGAATTTSMRLNGSEGKQTAPGLPLSPKCMGRVQDGQTRERRDAGG